MAEAIAPTSAGSRHFLTFCLDDRRYALPAETVSEVIRLPVVARMPQSPPGLLGLANLRGAILPVASGRNILGQTPSPADMDNTRAVILNGSAPVAVAVDAVLGLVEIPLGQIETRTAEIAALPGEQLLGAFKTDDGTKIIKLLDIQSLLKAAFVARERTRRTTKVQGAVVDEVGQQAIQQKMVAFAIAGQEYALALETVQEIVPAPSLLASVPHSESLVLGVASFRDALLPLLSMRGLLGFPRNADLQREKVVVVRIHDNIVGLVVDEMRAIFPAVESRIEALPEVLAVRIGGESRIAAIYRGDQGLVSILAPETLFGDEVMQKLDKARATAPVPNVADDAKTESRQFLVFRLDGQEFGLPIGAVEEVARVPDTISRVPKTPKFLEGVVNLRGEVLPVIDQRKRFSLPPSETSASRRLIVVRTERHLAGLIVDSVSEVLRTDVETIDVAPDLNGEETPLVSGVVNLQDQNRIILLLDPSELLTRAERGLLDTFRKQTGAES